MRLPAARRVRLRPGLLRRGGLAGVLLTAALLVPAGCGRDSGDGASSLAVNGEDQEARDAAAAVVGVRIPAGASADDIGGRLRAAGLVRFPRAFVLFAQLRGLDGDLKSGHYEIPGGASWNEILRQLARGEVVTVSVTIPEGFSLREIVPRIATISGVSTDSVAALVASEGVARRLTVPGPTLEGYLFPETYRFAEGVDPERVLETLVQAYRDFWTPELRARADSLGLDEREVVTLASIVEEEAKRPEERSVIARVYLNRLERGMLLQADPTVQYALGEPRERLLYRDIESVADHPYNTYTHTGLPPGPIASPGRATLEATLAPADVPFLYFVARPDGSHVFTRSAREHINAKNKIRRDR